MNNVDYCWVDSKFVPWKEAKIHFLTHALHYGGAAFEGIRFYKTDQGSAVFRLQDHLKRLYYSASQLGLKTAFSQKALIEVIKKLIKMNKIQEGYLRPMIYYGYGKMGVDPVGAPANLAIALWKWEKHPNVDSVRAGISTWMRLHPQSFLPNAKITGFYANSILAGLQVRQKGYNEAILLDYKGNVAEGPGENVFMVKNGELFTPAAGSILPGITRDSIFKLVKDLKLPCKELKISPKFLLVADEAFYCGTATEIMPIVSINGKKIGNGKIGSITQRLKDFYAGVVHGYEKKYFRWLTFI